MNMTEKEINQIKFKTWKGFQKIINFLKNNINAFVKNVKGINV